MPTGSGSRSWTSSRTGSWPRASHVRCRRGVDPLPTAFFAESPIFAKDQATEAYIQACHMTKVGDPIPDAYAQSVLVAAQTSDATEAYNARRYQAALDRYAEARRMPGGEQLRVLNGLYLANLKLNNRMPRRRRSATWSTSACSASGWQPSSCSARAPRSSCPIGASAASIRCGWKEIATRSRQGEPMPRDRGAHQPDGPGRPQRSAFQAARRGHPQAPGRRGVRARRQADRQGRRLPREHRRDRPGRCQRCARPPRGVQRHRLRLAPQRT